MCWMLVLACKGTDWCLGGKGGNFLNFCFQISSLLEYFFGERKGKSL